MIQFGSSIRPLLQFFLVLPIVLAHFNEISISNYFFYSSIVAIINIISNSNLVINNLGNLSDENTRLYISSGFVYDFIVKSALLIVFVGYFLFSKKDDSDIFFTLICQSFFLNLDSISNSTMLIRNYIFRLITNEFIYLFVFIIAFFVMRNFYSAKLSLLSSIVLSAFSLFVLQCSFLYPYFNVKLVFNKDLYKFSILNSSSSLVNALAVNADKFLFYFILSAEYYNTFSVAKQIWNYLNTLSGGFYKGFLSAGKNVLNVRTSKSVALFFSLNFILACFFLFFGDIVFSWYSSNNLQNISLFLTILMIQVLLRIVMIQDTLYLSMGNSLKKFLKVKIIISSFHLFSFGALYFLIQKCAVNLDLLVVFFLSVVISNIDILCIKYFNVIRVNHYIKIEVSFILGLFIIYYVWNFWI